MSLFIILFILIALFAVMDYYSQHNIGLFLSAIVLAVVAGIRYNVGYDYQSYYWYYQSGLQSAKFQWGFTLLNKLAQLAHLSVFDFQLLFSCLTIGLLVYFLYKYIPLNLRCFAILYYFSRFYWTRDLGQIRSSLASVICLYSLKYIREKRPIAFLVTVLIAGGIHKGAYIFVFAYIMANLLNKNLSTLKTIIFLLGSLVLGEVLQHIPSLVAQITGGGVYITNKYVIDTSTASSMTLIMQVIIIIAYVLLKRYQQINNARMDTIANVYLTGVIVAVLFIGYKTFAYRLDTILNTTEIILVPYMIQRVFKNRFLVILLNIIVSAFILYLIMFVSKGYLNFIPFNTIFSPIK